MSEKKRNFNKEDSYRNLDRVNQWIFNCDQKTSIVLAFITVFILIIFSSNFINTGIKSMIKMVGILTFTDIINFTIVVALISLLIFLYYLFQAVSNFIKALTANLSFELERELVKDSNIFFGTISNKKYKDFVESLNNLSEDELIQDVNSQTYINSKICMEKFKQYNLGIQNLKKMFIASILMIILFYFLQVV